MEDPLGAFVPHGHIEVDGSAGWSARRRRLRGQGHLRRRRHRDRLRQPGLAGEPARGPERTRRRSGCCSRRRPPGRQDRDRGTGLQRGRHQPALRHALQRRAPGRVPGGSSSGSAAAVGGGLVARARQRHRRLGPRAGELQRHLRHAPDPWPDQPRRRDAAGAELRHGRLVRARSGAVRDRRPRAARRPGAVLRAGSAAAGRGRPRTRRARDARGSARRQSARSRGCWGRAGR